MQYSFVKACLLALAATSSVIADAVVGFNVITAPTAGEVIEAGSTYTIKWAASDPAAPISLILLQGSSNTTLEASNTPIASGISSASGKYEWAVPSDAGGFAAYGIRLELDSDPLTTFQYSNPFTIHSANGGAETKTVQLSQISTSAAPTSTSTSTSAPAPISTSTPTPSSTKEVSTSILISSSAPVVVSSSAPSTTAEASTTAAPITSVVETNSTVPATTIATSIISGSPSGSATTSHASVPTGAASINAIARGSGLVGAIALLVAML